MNEKSYIKVRTVDEALARAGEKSGNYTYIAGGSDILPSKKNNLSSPSSMIDIRDIAELAGIELRDNSLVIGSAVSLHDLAKSPRVKESYPLVSEAAGVIATPVIRKTATVGGNLLVANRCTYYNQSELWRESAGSCLRETGATCLVTGGLDKCYSRNVSDLAPALIALEAKVTLRNRETARTVAVADLYNADGIHYHNLLNKDDIITSIIVSSTPDRWFFRKLRRRGSLDFSSATMAAAVTGNTARVCFNAVSMSPVLLTVNLSEDKLADTKKIALRSCKTVNNDILSQSYRRKMITVFLEQFWYEMGGQV